MRIGFVSTDEVNRSVARQIAPSGMRIECFTSGAPVNHVAAWVYDVDQLPSDVRTSVLLSLNSGEAKTPATVISYSLSDQQTSGLLRAGVRVERRLEAKVFNDLKEELARRNTPPEFCRLPACEPNWATVSYCLARGEETEPAVS